MKLTKTMQKQLEQLEKVHNCLIMVGTDHIHVEQVTDPEVDCPYVDFSFECNELPFTCSTTEIGGFVFDKDGDWRYIRSLKEIYNKVLKIVAPKFGRSFKNSLAHTRDQPEADEFLRAAGFKPVSKYHGMGRGMVIRWVHD
jgi:hypothetical protein